jgi:hypothetical protein
MACGLPKWLTQAARESSQWQKQKAITNHTNHFHSIRTCIVSYKMVVVLEDKYVPTATIVIHVGELKLITADWRKGVSHWWHHLLHG